MSRAAAKGMSLIELMVALLIGTILVLGLVEVFAASRTAYQMSEGMARVQENSRFAMDYLQRDLRMVGHFGCVNDQSHLQTAGELHSHLDPALEQLQFGVSVQGYEAQGTAPGDDVDLTAAAGNWAPALPTYIKDGLAPLGGSDIIVLRFLSPEGVPVSSFAATPGSTTITVTPARWATLTSNGVANPKFFGIADCNYADIFEAATAPPTGTLTVTPTGLNTTDFTSDRYSASPAGQAMLYRAEAVVYYIADGAAPGLQRSLWRARYTSSATPDTEELVEGVDSLQFLYGLDTAAAAAGTPTGYINDQVTADAVSAAESRYVGLIRVGMLVKSPNRAAAAGKDTAPNALGVNFTLPTPYDGNYRSTYESTVALRNRLYGN